MRRLLVILVAVVATLGNVSCGDSKSKRSPGVPPVDVETSPRTGVDTGNDTAYELLAIQVQTIFEKNCISCHRGANPAAGLNLTIESVIVAKARDIANFILDGELPEQERLTDEEVEIIRAWQVANYPRPKNKPTPKPGDGSGNYPIGDKPNQNDPSQNKDGDYNKDEAPTKDGISKKRRILKRLLQCTSSYH